MDTQTQTLNNRYDILVLLSAKNSKPQGDTIDNEPRIDPDTMHGMITGQGLKRHARDYLQGVYGSTLWVARKADLSEGPLALAKELGLPTPAPKADSVRLDNEQEAQLTLSVANKYVDFKAFGGILTTFNVGVRGPVQVGMGETVDPVEIRRLGITRAAVANAAEAKDKDKTMGEVTVIPYGLYKIPISVCPYQAAKTGFTEDDLSTWLEAFLKSWTFTASSTRSQADVEAIYVFKHKSKLGNQPRPELYRRIHIEVKPTVDQDRPTSFEDYAITTNLDGLTDVDLYTVRTISDIAAIFGKKKAA